MERKLHYFCVAIAKGDYVVKSIRRSRQLNSLLGTLSLTLLLLGFGMMPQVEAAEKEDPNCHPTTSLELTRGSALNDTQPSGAEPLGALALTEENLQEPQKIDGYTQAKHFFRAVRHGVPLSWFYKGPEVEDLCLGPGTRRFALSYRF